MKILNICQKDYAGVGIALTNAVKRHTKHEARHLCMEKHHFQYPTDICTKDRNQILLWLEWADVVNCHVYPRPLTHAKFPPRAFIMTQHGTYLRFNVEKCREQHRKWGVKKALGTTPDLVKYDAKWLPVPITWLPTAIPAEKYAKMRRFHGGKPIVCQTPSNPKRKITNTARIRDLLGGREDLRLVLAHHLPHEDALCAKAVADIFIDRFSFGLGVNGLEAAAMGIPVIACSSAEDEKYILGEIGYLPYYKASLKTLEAAIDELLSKQTVYEEYADRGRQYIRDFHDYLVVAKKYADICEEVLRGN